MSTVALKTRSTASTFGKKRKEKTRIRFEITLREHGREKTTRPASGELSLLYKDCTFPTSENINTILSFNGVAEMMPHTCSSMECVLPPLSSA